MKNSMRFYQELIGTCQATFDAQIEYGVKHEPRYILPEIRDVAEKVFDPVGRCDLIECAVSIEDANLCAQRLRDSAVIIDQLGLDHFSECEEIRWQIGRTLHRLGHPEEALKHIAYVCQVSDTPDLRPKAFARLAEIGLEQYFDSNDHGLVGPTFEAACMANHIERSNYTKDLLQSADETLHESWRHRFGFITYPGVAV